MFINSKSTSFTIAFTTMETLTVQIPEDPSIYFLEFSSKEEYLKKRDEWRTIYKWLSKAIRHNKHVCKARVKANAKIYRRMNKKGWYLYSLAIGRENYSNGLAEYNERVKKATADIPKELSWDYVDAPQMLEIRQEMKVKSSRQRELSLMAKT